MARLREKGGTGEIDAVRNTGTWPPIIEFLDSVGAGRIPVGSRPPVTRNEDGSLHVCAPGGCSQADVGDWITLTDGVFHVVKPGDVETNYEEIHA